MRKISRLAARAFIEGRSFTRDNTSVKIEHRTPEGLVRKVLDLPSHPNRRLYLHGNLIAEYTNAKGLRITLAGWNTPTTRERLNTLLTETGKREGIWQHKFNQYYGTHDDNRVISSTEWITVT